MKISKNRLAIEFVITLVFYLLYFKPQGVTNYMGLIIAAFLSSILAELLVFKQIDRYFINRK